MTTALIYSLAPLKLNSTVLAVSNLALSPEIMANPFRHSGNLFPSVISVPGAGPQIRFSTPFAEAYSLIGFGPGPLKCTTVEVYLAKFVDAARSSSSVHTAFKLASSPGAALGFAYITGASVDSNGVFMADVTVMLTSYDGMTHPLARTDNNALPTLASEPVLYSLGPMTVNGTTVAGEASCSLNMGPNMQALPSDGDLYPKTCAMLGYDRVMTVDFKDPTTAWSTLTTIGVNITANVVQYFRQYSATTQVKTAANGLSITVASGRVVPDAINLSNLGIADGPARVIGLSSSATDPWVLATGVSVPTT